MPARVGASAPTIVDVPMPQLSDSMQEGTVVRWLAADGESIGRGQEIVEIETDKATVTHEAEIAGVLEHVAHEGDTLRVGDTIARIRSPSRARSGAAAGSTGRSMPADGDGTTHEPRLQTPAPSGPQRPAAANASPIARRFATRLGIDIAQVKGSGPQGRILKADITAHRDAESRLETSVPTDSALPKGAPTVEQPTRIQQLIARRMAESRATIPDFTLRTRVDMEACAKLRDELKPALVGDDTRIPSYNDLIVKACALALRAHPRANASYRDGTFELHSRVNVGVAVATADSLVVPTIFDAGAKSLGRIARETRTLVERVRAGTVSPSELTGATFTVSNLGMFGIESFDAVINPPQAAILAVGQIIRAPTVIGDDVLQRLQMKLSLTCDHRILYGADAAGFLSDIKSHLEEPIRLLIARDSG